MINLDLYLLITQGQYSPDRSEYWTPDGFYIFVEEEIVVVPRRGGSGSGLPGEELVKRKKITLHVNGDGFTFKKSIFVDNINLKVSDVTYDTLQNIIKVELFDIEFSDIKKTINIDTKSKD
jgi:hypothetical protein